METNTMLPMTKARAAEMLYETMRRELKEKGGVTEQDKILIKKEFTEDFVKAGFSEAEADAFIEFLERDVNQP